MLLALDISTSCVGWCVYDYSKKLVAAGAIETKKCKSNDLYDKMDYVIDELWKIIQDHKVTISHLAAEAALKKFSGGKTTANTMAMLIGFNFCLCYNMTRKLGCSSIMLDVRAARRVMKITIPKGAKDKKVFVITQVKPMYPNLDWALKKTGKYKDWCGDMADAIVIGEVACKQLK